MVAPLNRIGRRYAAVTWTTDRAGGFTTQDLAIFEEIHPALAAIVETSVVRSGSSSSSRSARLIACAMR